MLAAISAGEELAASGERGWQRDLLAAGLPQAGSSTAPTPTVTVTLEGSRDAFRLPGAAVVTRGVVSDGTWVAMSDVGGSGFDLLLHAGEATLEVIARYRPALPTRALNTLVGSRFTLLSRQVLLQYPALWWAGVRGRAPLHASVLAVSASTVLLAGPGGVGKSTLLLGELTSGARATSDNLCVSDGQDAYGLLEPMRVEGGTGRRTSHGRREQALPGRTAVLTPDRLLVLSRSGDPRTQVRPATAERAARVLAAGTYAAGELRRYWAFAASLALATDRGPAQPAVAEVARRLATSLPCTEAVVGAGDQQPLGQLLAAERVLS